MSQLFSGTVTGNNSSGNNKGHSDEISNNLIKEIYRIHI